MTQHATSYARPIGGAVSATEIHQKRRRRGRACLRAVYKQTVEAETKHTLASYMLPSMLQRRVVEIRPVLLKVQYVIYLL